VLALGVVQQDPDIWPEPERWDPTRFDATVAKARTKEWGPLVFAPFGFAGGRVCPGSRLTLVETSLFLSALVERVRFELAVPGQDPGTTHGLVTHPTDDVRLVIQPRTWLNKGETSILASRCK
jgi:cytochrome P450 family 20 subfamily A